MTSISRYRVAWSGFPGGPGVSTFYGTVGIALGDFLQAFFNVVKAVIPSDVTIKVPNAGDNIDDATGQLDGSWTEAGSHAAIVGTLGQVYAAPVGFGINWKTGVVANGHRIVGRTFLVPAQQDSATGAPTSAGIAIVQGAANTLVTDAAGHLLVWHRPKPPAAGSSAAVNAGVVIPKYVVLRSRRD